MKYIDAVALVAFLIVTLASARDQPVELDWTGRYPELKHILRTETRAPELIDAIVEYYRYPGHLDVKPPPDGFAYEQAQRRISDNPARYAPEIERRMLELLPKSIENTDALLAFGDAETLSGQFGRENQFVTLGNLIELLPIEHADPILRHIYDRASVLLKQAEPIYDRIIMDWDRQAQRIEDRLAVYEGIGALWRARSQMIIAALKLDSPLFIDDSLEVLARIRQRPDDWFITNFAAWTSDYLPHFVEQRPDIYTRLLPLSDPDEMMKLGDAARNLSLEIPIHAMRKKLIEAGKLAPEE